MMTYRDHKGNPLSAEALRDCFERAQIKSRLHDPRLARTRQVAPCRYEVTGDTGVYLVLVDPTGFHCACLAGQNQRVCWHAASVYRARLVEKMLSAAAVMAPSMEAVKARLPRLEDLYTGYEGN